VCTILQIWSPTKFIQTAWDLFLQPDTGNLRGVQGPDCKKRTRTVTLRVDGCDPNLLPTYSFTTASPCPTSVTTQMRRQREAWPPSLQMALNPSNQPDVAGRCNCFFFLNANTLQILP